MSFDLLETQREARLHKSDGPKLYKMWDDVCGRYDRREIGIYDLEEMKSVIFPAPAALESLKNNVNSPIIEE